MSFKTVTLEELLWVPIRNGLTKPKRVRGEGTKMVNMGEIFAFDRIHSVQEMDRVPLTENELQLNLLQTGDLLFARQSLVASGAGKCSIVVDTDEDLVFESHLIRVRLNPDIANPYFYYYFFASKLGRGLINTIVEQVSAAGIRGSDLIKLEVPFPRMEIQNKIASLLTSIDEKIENIYKTQDVLEQMTQTLFKHWLVDFEFPNQFGEPYKSSGGILEWREELGLSIPADWSVSKLSDIAEYRNGLALQKFRPKNEDDWIPVIKIRELNQGTTLNDSERADKHIDNRYIVDDGDVLFSWSGTLLVKIWTGGVGALNQHLFKVTSDKYPKWYYYLWTQHYLDRFKGIAADKATTMGHIKRADLDSAVVLVPNDQVFERMTELLSPIIDKQVTIMRQARTLSDLRETLVPKLMTRKIDVSSVEHELAVM